MKLIKVFDAVDRQDVYINPDQIIQMREVNGTVAILLVDSSLVNATETMDQVLDALSKA